MVSLVLREVQTTTLKENISLAGQNMRPLITTKELNQRLTLCISISTKQKPKKPIFPQ